MSSYPFESGIFSRATGGKLLLGVSVEVKTKRSQRRHVGAVWEGEEEGRDETGRDGTGWGMMLDVEVWRL